MLVVSRSVGERIIITIPPCEYTQTITVDVVAMRGNSVRIGLDAPPEISIVRDDAVLTVRVEK